jgi:hypothetical protein
MKRETDDGKEEDSGSEPQERRSQQRVNDRQRSGRGSASALSRLKMLERRYQLPIPPGDPEKR